jgi:uncharacterized protein (TIGR02266 family)
MKIVFPVRFAAHRGLAVQTTCCELTDSSLLVVSPRHRPPADALLALRLYLPDSHPPAGAMGRVRERGKDDGEGGFWLDVVDTVRGVADRVRQLVSRCSARVKTFSADPSPHRTTTRFPASLPICIEGEGLIISASSLNLSASGVFVRTRELVRVGSVVGVRLALPDEENPVAVQAKVVHHLAGGPRHAPWSEPGLGLQFIDGDDAFRSRLDRHLALIADPHRGLR